MPIAIDLTGRVAIVTGGHGGLGRVIVSHLATAGAKVVVFDRLPTCRRLSLPNATKST